MQAPSGDVQSDLPKADPHTIGTKVAQPQDSFSICDNYKADLWIRYILEDLVNQANVVWVDVNPPGAPLNVTQLHAGHTYGRRVNDWDHLSEVIQD
ncbi:MAG: hypothetical protein BWX66_01096 [Deltaproteobacteria bacterium ADurb.Bin058]|nr:MAG: hypothetical protein BWX66_01096 [Deltaproteobacteria bacterium ADurb.Bin058]